MSTPSTILFVGGGTGGHIFPNLAVAQRLHARQANVHCHFVVSTRPVDQRILDSEAMAYTTMPAQPLGARPGALGRFLRGYHRTRRRVRALIEREPPAAMVGTGGFVCGPAFAAAREARLATALINLDAVPGRANRLTARKASAVFTAHRIADWPGATRIGVPLRNAVRAQTDSGQARGAFNLPPDQPTLLVTAGSQGARSINRLMMGMSHRPAMVKQLAHWSIIHLCGEHDQTELRAAYEGAGLANHVQPFCDRMGLAWSAANLAISRAGAGSVAEAWSSTTPTIFLPYPHHKDEHQRHNAMPLVEAGGARLLPDHGDAEADAGPLAQMLQALLGDEAQRAKMESALATERPFDGAEAVAQWVVGRVSQA